MSFLSKLLIIAALLVVMFHLPIRGQKIDPELGLVSDAKWVKYDIGRDSVSVDLPKLPVVLYEMNVCESYERYIYAAYNDDVVYTAVVTKGIKGQNMGFCSRFSRFGSKVLENRVEQLITSKKVEKTEIAGLKEHII